AVLRRVEPVVAVVLEERPVEAVRAGPRRGHDLPGRAAAVLRLAARGQDLDLADHVRREREVLEERDHPALAHVALLHAGAVEHGLVARLHPAVETGPARG